MARTSKRIDYEIRRTQDKINGLTGKVNEAKKSLLELKSELAEAKAQEKSSAKPKKKRK